ncbi:hypothetical protein [Mesohalobacter salilacus]
MSTETEKTKDNKIKVAKDTNSKKVSKTWLAALSNRGTGKIIDMEAVLK